MSNWISAYDIEGGECLFWSAEYQYALKTSRITIRSKPAILQTDPAELQKNKTCQYLSFLLDTVYKPTKIETAKLHRLETDQTC